MMMHYWFSSFYLIFLCWTCIYLISVSSEESVFSAQQNDILEASIESKKPTKEKFEEQDFSSSLEIKGKIPDDINTKPLENTNSNNKNKKSGTLEVGLPAFTKDKASRNSNMKKNAENSSSQLISNTNPKLNHERIDVDFPIEGEIILTKSTESESEAMMTTMGSESKPLDPKTQQTKSIDSKSDVDALPSDPSGTESKTKESDSEPDAKVSTSIVATKDKEEENKEVLVSDQTPIHKENNRITTNVSVDASFPVSITSGEQIVETKQSEPSESLEKKDQLMKEVVLESATDPFEIDVVETIHPNHKVESDSGSDSLNGVSDNTNAVVLVEEKVLEVSDASSSSSSESESESSAMNIASKVQPDHNVVVIPKDTKTPTEESEVAVIPETKVVTMEEPSSIQTSNVKEKDEEEEDKQEDEEVIQEVYAALSGMTDPVLIDDNDNNNNNEQLNDKETKKKTQETTTQCDERNEKETYRQEIEEEKNDDQVEEESMVNYDPEEVDNHPISTQTPSRQPSIPIPTTSAYTPIPTPDITSNVDWYLIVLEQLGTFYLTVQTSTYSTHQSIIDFLQEQIVPILSTTWQSIIQLWQTHDELHILARNLWGLVLFLALCGLVFGFFYLVSQVPNILRDCYIGLDGMTKAQLKIVAFLLTVFLGFTLKAVWSFWVTLAFALVYYYWSGHIVTSDHSSVSASTSYKKSN